MLDQLRNLVAQLRFRGMEAALDAEIARAERGSVPAVAHRSAPRFVDRQSP